MTHACRTHLAGSFQRGIALVAVGGYGRRELFPHSDVDLLILVNKELDPDEERQSLSVFLRSLWDQNLRLSQSVRTVAECTRFDETNIELSISLLDARFLIGVRILSAERYSKLRSANVTGQCSRQNLIDNSQRIIGCKVGIDHEQQIGAHKLQCAIAQDIHRILPRRRVNDAILERVHVTWSFCREFRDKALNRRHVLGKVSNCLLYTSPSPRD